MRSHLLCAGAAAAVVVSGVVPAQAAPAAGVAPAAATGISVTVSGLTGGVRPAITITGPSGKRTITRTTTLTGLKPGAYLVAAPTLRVPKGSLVPTPRSQRITVTAGRTAAARIAYAFVGQPVTVSGSAGSRGVVFASATAGFAIRIVNASASRRLASATVVVPRGFVTTRISAPTARRGAWSATTRACGRTPNCSALVVLAARRPSGALRRGDTLAITLTEKAPATPGAYAFRLVSIGSGYFTVRGAEATLRVAAGSTVAVTPNTPVTRTQQVGSSTVEADLPHGGYGTVSLYYEPVACPRGPCATATLEGTFTNPADPTEHLYTNTDPAKFTITCTAANCPPVGPSGNAAPTALAAGNQFTCALMSNGTVGCWGSGAQGVLGHANTGVAETTLQVIPELTSATAIAAGDRHVCALRANGTVLCWGAGSKGQLGSTPATPDASSPTPLLVPGINGAIAIAAGTEHSCAVIDTGDVACWGNNAYLQAGAPSGTTTAPTFVGLTDAVSVVAGERHTCALRANGLVSCWGDNDLGQMGLPDLSTMTAVPIEVPGVSTATSIAAGTLHSCVRTAAGTAVCWGNNSAGQAAGTKSIAIAPRTVASGSGPITGITAVMAGARSSHTCATVVNGSTLCWGANKYGQLGTTSGNLSNSGQETPQAATGITTAIASAQGFDHTCVLVADHTVLCFGRNASGQLGFASAETNVGGEVAHPVAASAAGLGGTGSSDAVSVSAGEAHTCAVLTSSAVACWGDNEKRQSGADAVLAYTTPHTIGGVTGAIAVTAGREHSCALVVGGRVWCWGTNAYGQAGTAAHSGAADPVIVPVMVPVSGAIAVDAGDFHTCALIVDGTVSCWGTDGSGQTGNPATATAQPTPSNLTVPGLATSVSAGGGFTCSRTAGGGSACWGSNLNGELGVEAGYLATAANPVPAVNPYLPTSIRSVEAGLFHACAVTAVGQAYCWGTNSYAQIGQSASVASTPVAQVIADGTLVHVARVAPGGNHTCVLISDGSMACWGRNFEGEFGESSGFNQFPFILFPIPHTESGVSDARGITAGSIGHTCLSLATGGLRCFGFNSRGQLGNGTSGITDATATTYVPQVVLGVAALYDSTLDASAYPIQVALKVSGAYRPFTVSPPCRDGSEGVGALVSPAAIAAGHCLDVNAIYRTSNGSLVRTILFVEDPRFTPIRR